MPLQVTPTPLKKETSYAFAKEVKLGAAAGSSGIKRLNYSEKKLRFILPNLKKLQKVAEDFEDEVEKAHRRLKKEIYCRKYNYCLVKKEDLLTHYEAII